MVAEIVTARVHHPKIRHTQTLDPAAGGLFPGFAHITQDHVHHPLRSLVILRLSLLRGVRGFPSFDVDIRLAHLHERICRDLTRGFFLCGGEQAFLSEPAPIRVAEEVLDVRLDCGGEEVALDRRDALGRLRRDDVDAEDAAVGFRQLDSYLRR